jgi:hypothetical protein
MPGKVERAGKAVTAERVIEKEEKRAQIAGPAKYNLQAQNGGDFIKKSVGSRIIFQGRRLLLYFYYVLYTIFSVNHVLFLSKISFLKKAFPFRPHCNLIFLSIYQLKLT